MGIIASDFHVRGSNEVYSKVVSSALSKLLKRAKEHAEVMKNNKFIFTGDFWDNLNISFMDMFRMMRFFAKLVEYGYEVHVIPGNHDRKLERDPLKLCSFVDGVRFHDKISGFVDGDFRYIFIPFEKGRTDEKLFEEVSKILEGDKKRNIIFAHNQIGSPKIREDYRYKDIEAELPFIEGTETYCLGHIHLHQEYKIRDAKIIYPGSISKVNFGEKDYENGFAYFEDGKFEFEEIESPDFVEVEITDEKISDVEIRETYAGKIVKLIVKSKDVDLIRMKNKFEKHCFVGNISRSVAKKEKFDKVNLELQKFSPLNALKESIKKLEIEKEEKKAVYEIGKKVIQEATE